MEGTKTGKVQKSIILQDPRHKVREKLPDYDPCRLKQSTENLK